MADFFTHTGATFSPCRTWRYTLWRQWDVTKPWLVMLMLNPSTADEDNNDPTVGRCEKRARLGGFGALLVLNIFAYRDKNPEAMKAFATAGGDAIGPENDTYLRIRFSQAKEGGDTVCAGWGIHGSFMGRDAQVQALAEAAGVRLQCLGLVESNGAPRHPLYLKNDAPFTDWSPRP